MTDNGTSGHGAATPDSSSAAASALDRSTYLGSSDAAPIAGLSKWATPATVWMRKVGLADDTDPTLRMWLGKRMEPILAELYEAKTGAAPQPVIYPDGSPHAGNVVTDEGPPVLHPDYPFIGCHPDAVGVEFKTSDSGRGFGEDGSVVTLDDMAIPLSYWVQVQHQNAVMGWSESDLGVLIRHDDFRRYIVPADPDFIANMMAAEVEFWGYVQRREPPPDDDPAARIALLNALYPQPENPARPPTPEEAMTVAEWRHLKALREAAEKEELAAKAAVVEIIGDSEGLLGEVSYKARKGRKTYNAEGLISALVKLGHPEVASLHTGTGKPSRTLLDTKKETTDE